MRPLVQNSHCEFHITEFYWQENNLGQNQNDDERGNGANYFHRGRIVSHPILQRNALSRCSNSLDRIPVAAEADSRDCVMGRE